MEKRKRKSSKLHLGVRFFTTILIGLVATPVVATTLLLMSQIPMSMALLYGTIPGIVFGGLVGAGIGGLNYIHSKQKLEKEINENENLWTEEENNNDKNQSLAEEKAKAKKEQREQKKAERKQQKEIKKQQKLENKQEKISEKIKKGFNEEKKRAKEESARRRNKVKKNKINDIDKENIVPFRKQESKKQQPESQTTSVKKETKPLSTYHLDKNNEPKTKTVLFSDPYNQMAKKQNPFNHNLTINEEKIVADVLARLTELNRQLEIAQQELIRLQQQLAELEKTNEYQTSKTKVK